MKIYDIISEAPNIGPTTTTSGGIIMPANSKTTQAKTSSGKGLKGIKSKNPFNIIKSKIKGATPQSVSDTIEKFKTDLKTNRKAFGKNVKRFELWDRAYKRNVSRAIRVLGKMLGLGILIESYWSSMNIAEEFVKDGTMTQAKYEEYRKFRLGWLATTLGANAYVLSKIKKLLKRVSWLVRIIKWVAAGAGTVFSGGTAAVAAIGTALATEYAQIRFILWLDSQAGWASQVILLQYIITGIGSLGARFLGDVKQITTDAAKSEKPKEKDTSGQAAQPKVTPKPKAPARLKGDVKGTKYDPAALFSN